MPEYKESTHTSQESNPLRHQHQVAEQLLWVEDRQKTAAVSETEKAVD